MKLSYSIFFLLCLSVNAQVKFHIIPFLGQNIGVSNINHKNLQNTNSLVNEIYIKYNRFEKKDDLAPIPYGFKLEIEKNKHFFSIGYIGGDNTYSNQEIGVINVDYFSYPLNYPNSNMIFLGASTGAYLNKISFSYNYSLFYKNHFQKRENRFVEFKLHTGFNFIFYEKWQKGDFDYMKFYKYQGKDVALIQPYSLFVPLSNGNTLSGAFYQANLNKGYSISFDLGFNIDWHIKNKRVFTTSFYYEQGTRELFALYTELYINQDFVGTVISNSRGSALQFKLLFPIEVFKRNDIYFTNKQYKKCN